MPPVSSAADVPHDAWRGTSRYRVTRRLGAGAMGVVYEAVDAQSGDRVALKTLPTFAAAALSRFKQEFRTLADVRHENLVQLFELVVSSDAPAFFAMELVDGQTFLRHVWGAWADDAAETARLKELQTRTRTIQNELESGPVLAVREPLTPQTGPVRPCAANLSKLLPALRQLCEGLSALHAAGKLHRDIKPSNVLVTGAGRVVILDFGVAADLRARADVEDVVAGTPRYMAPEVALWAPATPASDWYTVGVMLYEALVGHPPFEGSTIEMLSMKFQVLPIRPSHRVTGVPGDLDDLCMDLLRIDAASRPSGREVLARVASASGDATHAATPISYPPAIDLIGREGELARLEEAFELVRSGRGQTVLVGGAPGVGKSALVHRFVENLQRREEAAVLFGRAYERESLPYKAIDGVIDALSRRLAREGEIELPDEAWALARLFPVLERVPWLLPKPEGPAVDPQAVRRRAFGALRRILAELSVRRPLVVFIDDVQWGDTDSVAALLEIVRPPDAPRLLLVMTYRDEEATRSEFLRDLRGAWPARAALQEVRVGPLGAQDAERLALEVLGRSDAEAVQDARGIARESAGSPLLVEELARYGRADAQDVGFGGVTLERMIRERLGALAESARTVAELVAVSGRPLSTRIVAAAAGMPAGLSETGALLQKHRFVRASLRDGREVVEPVHDRIREAIVHLLAPEVMRDRHARLAVALEAMHGDESEAIATHLLGAGETARASTYAEAAAEAASSKLAFEQAARLFRVALETAESGEREQTLRMRIAQSFEQAGRPSAAADAYREAARGAVALERVKLEATSAGLMLRAGRIQDGISRLEDVLTAMGLSAPRGAVDAVLRLVVYRFAIRFASARPTLRDTRDVPMEDRVRLEALQAVAGGMAFVNALLGMCMQARLHLLALRVGDPEYLMRAMCVRLGQLGAMGPAKPKEHSLRDRALNLAEKVGPEGLAYYHATQGMALHLRGMMVTSLSAFEAARKATPSGRMLPYFRVVEIWSLIYAGRLRVAARTAKDFVREVDEDGDVYSGVCVRCPALIEISMIEDDPESGRRCLKEAAERWTPPGFTVQHWYIVIFGAHLELYCGRSEEAYQGVKSRLPAIKKAFLMRVPPARRHTLYMLARAAIASSHGVTPAERRRRLAEARRCARSLQRLGTPVDRFYAAVVRGALANALGRRDEAVTDLRAAVALGDETGPLYAWSAQYQLGRLLGGDEGSTLLEAAEAFFAREGVRAPARYAGAFVPGTWEPSPPQRQRAR